MCSDLLLHAHACSSAACARACACVPAVQPPARVQEDHGAALLDLLPVHPAKLAPRQNGLRRLGRREGAEVVLGASRAFPAIASTLREHASIIPVNMALIGNELRVFGLAPDATEARLQDAQHSRALMVSKADITADPETARWLSPVRDQCA